MLRRRAAMLAAIRRFFVERDVLEVHTQVLSSHTVTDVNVGSIAVADHGYLQSSPEYQMKRLLAAGAPSIFQIGPVFRSDESGALHNPEFTMLEWYRLGFDDARLRDEVAELVDLVLGPGAYVTRRFEDLLAEHADDAEERGDWSAAQRQDWRFSQALARHVDERLFVIDYPPAQAALARLNPSGQSAARFELVVNGIEIANGYFELGDAAELRRRFLADQRERRARQLEVPALDEHFLASMEHGLPECAGVALGIDRLLMLATGSRSIGEVMPFARG
jgi:lysyl-tRNA synthetase class 2